MTGKGKDRLLSLLKGDGDNVLEDVKTYVKKQKLSSDYLKKVLLRECGEKLNPESTIEGLVLQLVENIATGKDEGLSICHDHKTDEDGQPKPSRREKEYGDVDSDSSFQEGEWMVKTIQQLLSETRLIKNQVEVERSSARDRENHLKEKIIKLEKELTACHGLINELKETAKKTSSQMTRLEQQFGNKARHSAILSFSESKASSRTNVRSVHTSAVQDHDQNNDTTDGGKVGRLHSPISRPSEETTRVNVLSVPKTNVQDDGDRTDTDATSKNTYASTVGKSSADHDSDNDWQIVTNKKRVPTKIPDKPYGQLVGAERIKKRVYYVGGISMNCSSDDLKSFCKGNNCNVLDCRMMPSRRHGTLSARLVVDEASTSDIEKMSWPSHIFVRPWDFDLDRFSRRRHENAESRPDSSQ